MLPRIVDFSKACEMAIAGERGMAQKVKPLGRFGYHDLIVQAEDRAPQHYNTGRPHSSLGYKPPAPAAIVPPSNMAAKPTMH